MDNPTAVYISYLGLSPALYTSIPVLGPLIYIANTMIVGLLMWFGPLCPVQFGALLSIAGASIQVAGCWLAPHARNRKLSKNPRYVR